MNTGTIINLIFDAAGGSVSRLSREGVCGEAFGELPVPTRRGYTFLGWYLDGEPISGESIITSDADIRLVARWQKAKATPDRKRSMLKRQKVAIWALAAVAVVLVVAYIVVAQIVAIYSFVDTYKIDGVEYSDKYYVKKQDGVYKLFDKDGALMDTNGQSEDVFIARGSGNQYKIDPETGEHTLRAVVDAEDGEYGSGSILLIFPQIRSDHIYSVKMENEQGGDYTFYRTANDVEIEGYEDSTLEFDQDLFAKLCFSCGYLMANSKMSASSTDPLIPRLPDGSIDYAVYGLDTPQATYTISGILFKKNADGTDLYQNGKYVIDYDEDGNPRPDPEKTYTVHVGDAVLSGGGYYVRLEGRESVYIITTDYVADTILQPIESLIVPRVVFPVSVTMHSMGKEFFLEYIRDWTGEKLDSETVVAFTYSELDERINTMNSTRPYLPITSVMAGYNINENSAISVFESFYSIEAIACKRIGLSQEVLTEFGLDKDVYYLTYKTDTGEVNEDGEKLYATNELMIGQKTENGTYYVAAIPFDMIVEVDQYYLSFLEWDYMNWYNEAFIFHNIAYIRELHFQFGDQKYDFTLDHSNTYTYYIGSKMDSNGNLVQALQVVDLSAGALVEQGSKTIYRTKKGVEYEVVATVDLDTVRRVTNKDVILDPSLTDVVYVKETFYYVNENGENVRVSPNYIDRTIEKRDGKYYYIYQQNGQTVEIRVNRNLGDAVYLYKGLEVTLDIGAKNLLVSCEQYNGGTGKDPHVLDYSKTNTFIGDSGILESETITATDNFRKITLQLLQFHLEGDVNEAEFEAAMGMTVDEYLADPNKKATASIIALVEDYARVMNGYTYTDKNGEEQPWYDANNEQYIEYKFYMYSDWKALVTVELFTRDENGEFKTTAEDGVVGKFFVIPTVLDKLESDIEKLLNEEIIDATTKH